MTVASKMIMETGGTVSEYGEDVKRKKKKRSPRGSLCTTFKDKYKLTGESLGEGSYGKVKTCLNVFTGEEFAVKIIPKLPGLFNRSKMLKEIELYHLCQDQKNIIHLVEFFEENDFFYLVFEKIFGGPLFNHIQERGRFTEEEAASVIKDLAGALSHLHSLGVAHRDIKPDNVLCVHTNTPCQVRLCDFDLCSAPVTTSSSMTPTLLSPVGSLEFMAPEVVDTFILTEEDDDEGLSYTKSCDLWSLGVLLYILLCGSAPFSGECSIPDCGWDRGDYCSLCQSRLFTAIQHSSLAFPAHLWAGVSAQARDLTATLLVRDCQVRLTARQVLDHPWVVGGGRWNSHTGNNTQPAGKDCEDPRDNCSVPGSSLVVTASLVSPSVSSCSLLQRRRRSRALASSLELTDWNMKALT